MGVSPRPASPRPIRSLWLCLPRMLIHLVGIVVGLSLVLATWKLEVNHDLSWWIVCLPVTIALGIMFFLLTVAIVLWVHVTVLFFTGRLEVEHESEFRLDVLFRTAKICFLGHGFVTLLGVSLGLFFLKLYYWVNLPVVYPLLPLIVLGIAYIFLGLILKQPEVNSPWFLLVGFSLLGQSVALAIKLDHMQDSKRFPWAVTFAPSWVTYVLLLIYCVLSPLQASQHANGESGSAGAASSSETSYGAAEGSKERDVADSRGRLRVQLFKVVGIACWVVGTGLSQAALTLRLDELYKVSWLSVVLPALVGWILLLVFVFGPVAEYFTEVAELLMTTFSLAPLCDCLKDPNAYSEEEDALFQYNGHRSSTHWG